MAEAFIKFLPAEDTSLKTEIHAVNTMTKKKVKLIADQPYGKCQQALWGYNHGEHIQDAFPFLSADERNFMQTGLTSEEWDALFGEEEEETVYKCIKCGATDEDPPESLDNRGYDCPCCLEQGVMFLLKEEENAPE